MKKTGYLKLFSLTVIPLLLSFSVLKNNDIYETSAASLSNYTAVTEGGLTKTINLNDAEEQDIRDYYDGLSSLDASQLKGSNLLKNLKPILKNGQKYFKYDSNSAVWMYYEITDRDWTLSPANEIPSTKGTYDASTNTISDYVYGTSYADAETSPYLHLLYRNLGESHGYTRAWDSHGGTKEKPNGIDREHVWPKSHGFNEVMVGARGDPHHLIAGDHIVNNKHGDTSYGNVKVHDSTTLINTATYLEGNYYGESKTFAGQTVFEPQDSDKGDIARAVFYMVARYNNLAGNDSTIDSGNPNLSIANNVVTATGSSTSSTPYSIGILDDLLEWHQKDPVDEYERHRNNLIYNNYGLNRNPFIDFPQWVDIAFGSNTSNKSANITTDIVYVPGSSSQEYQEVDDEGEEEIIEEENETSSFDFTTNTYSENQNISSVNDSISTISFSKNDGTSPRFYNDSLRLYKTNSFEVTSQRKIKSITFTFLSPSSGNSNIYYNNGSNQITISSNKGIWTNTSTDAEKTSVDFAVISDGSSITVKITNITIEYYPLVESIEPYIENTSFTYGEGNGTGQGFVYTKEYLSTGDDPRINKEDPIIIDVDTYILGDKEYQYEFEGETKNVTFNVTNVGSSISGEYESDHLTADLFTAINSNYKGFENVSYDTLQATYSGNSALSTINDNAIQLRSNNSNSGIVQTSSGGNVTKVIVDWQTNTANGRTLNIYGSDTAFTSASELYETGDYTLLGTIVKGTSTEFTLIDQYSFIGIRSSSGAMYLNSIDICYSSSYTKQAESYSTYFLNKTGSICSLNNGSESNLDALTSIWDDLQVEFEAMDENSITEFETNNSNSTITSARERYVFIVSKYGFDNYTDISVSSLNHFKLFFENESSNVLLIASVIITVVTIGSYFVYRRKHC